MGNPWTPQRGTRLNQFLSRQPDTTSLFSFSYLNRRNIDRIQTQTIVGWARWAQCANCQPDLPGFDEEKRQ